MRGRGESGPVAARPSVGSCFDQALVNGVLITRLKSMPVRNDRKAKEGAWTVAPALKVCATTGLSKKDLEKAGVTIRHAITKIMTRKGNNKLNLPSPS